ncbi:MAG TPA: winged helix-turn-helix domain-containing protein [Ktedonobacteraceae bacterium]|nr:winged helix-turn-helix domain-containing protein [Ktedonobacteraceae bacterium]
MSELLPFLEICGPDRQTFRVELTKERTTIGRFEVYNDIALEPDPQSLITRKGHCTVERNMEGWWIVDNASVNRTFVRRIEPPEGGSRMEIVRGRAPLHNGDTILILGKLVETGSPLYWELTFNDPEPTHDARHVQQLVEQSACLEYDWVQAKLFLVDGTSRIEIPHLPPQEHKLVRYMAQRNQANGNVPVMCSYEELITAIWGDEPFHKETEINHLVWVLRKKLEPDPKNPIFLQTVHGLGYRLVTCS